MNSKNLSENFLILLFELKLILSISSNCVLTVINASAAVTVLEQRPEKIQALGGIRTHDLCDASSSMRIVFNAHTTTRKLGRICCCGTKPELTLLEHLVS